MNNYQPSIKYKKCPRDGKDCIPTKAAAEAEKIMRRDIDERYYFCTVCRHYHVTSQERTTSSPVFPVIKRLTKAGKAKVLSEVTEGVTRYEIRVNNAIYRYTFDRETDWIQIEQKIRLYPS